MYKLNVTCMSVRLKAKNYALYIYIYIAPAKEGRAICLHSHDTPKSK